MIRRWYESELGWQTAPGDPLGLVVGVRFDVLDVPAEAGRAALRHLRPASPVAVRGDRMWLLVAAGGAEELPGLLTWLEWGALALDLVPVGAGGVIEAPAPGAPSAGPDLPEPGGGALTGRPGGRTGTPQGAAWLRPPAPGSGTEASLPVLGGAPGAPDLVRVVDTVATWCHRIRLRCGRAPAPQPTL